METPLERARQRRDELALRVQRLRAAIWRARAWMVLGFVFGLAIMALPLGLYLASR